MGEFWLVKFSKRMKQSDLQQLEAAVSIGLSHTQGHPQVEPNPSTIRVMPAEQTACGGFLAIVTKKTVSKELQ